MTLRRYSTGGYGTISEPWYLMRPRLDRGRGIHRGMMFCNSAGSTETIAGDAAFPNLMSVFRRLVDAGGFTVLTPEGDDGIGADGGANTFGNDPAGSQYKAAADYLTSTLGATSGKVFLFGASMGCQTASNLWRRWPEKVAGMAFVEPAADLDWHHANDTPAGITAKIDTAYPEGWATAEPTHNPINIAPTITCPVLVFHNEADTDAPLANAEAFVAACQDATIVVSPTGGHGDGAWANVDVLMLIDFIRGADW